MADSLAQLLDIEGVDSVGWWPLAVGWWFVLGVLVVCVLGVVFFVRRWRRLRRRWQFEAGVALDEVVSVVGLSELVRRVAMCRFSRAECAGLEGEVWLRWLAEHDPGGFDWVAEGRCLVEAPFAPVCDVERDVVVRLVKAIRVWVK